MIRRNKHNDLELDKETGWFTTLAHVREPIPLKKELHPGQPHQSRMIDKMNDVKIEGVDIMSIEEKIEAKKQMPAKLAGDVTRALESSVLMYTHDVVTFAQELVSKSPTLADDLRFYLNAELQDKEIS